MLLTLWRSHLCGLDKMLKGFQCRSCQSTNGQLVLDLGEQPLANNFLELSNLGQSEPRFPLHLAVCTECWLMQIIDLVPPVELFSDYVYFSSYSSAWVKHAAECAERYQKEFKPNHVIEIASNDGYFLRHFAEANISHLGIEPAENIAFVARQRGVKTRVDFFSESLARELALDQCADLIIANNVFAHIPDIKGFVSGLKVLLAPAGRAILEFPHAVEMITRGEFDTVYHEHVYYFTLTALEPFFARHEMCITRVERTPLHGGSLRIFVQHTTHEPDETVAQVLEEEKRLGVTSLGFYGAIASRAKAIKEELQFCLHEYRAKGQRIAAYGAAAKGSVLLNYCDFTPDDVEFVVDRSPHKQGKFMPGTHLPVLAVEELIKRAPEVTLLLAWNFADEILCQQSAYREAGGQFLIPIPEIRLV